MISGTIAFGGGVATQGQTHFTFEFRADSYSVVHVYRNGARCVAYPTVPGGPPSSTPVPVVTLNADQVAHPGGSVDFTSGEGIDELDAGDLILIRRSTPITQALTLPDFGAFDPGALELALDKIIMILQEMQLQYAFNAIPQFESDSPVAINGMVWYNTTEKKFKAWVNGVKKELVLQ